MPEGQYKRVERDHLLKELQEELQLYLKHFMTKMTQLKTKWHRHSITAPTSYSIKSSFVI